MTYYILLTIDVEEWFQVENFKQCIPFSSWSSYELRVKKNTHRLLDLLDEVSNQRLAFRVPQGPEQGRRAISCQQDSAISTQGSNLDPLTRAQRSSSEALFKPAPLNACPVEFRFADPFGGFNRAGLFNWGAAVLRPLTIKNEL